MSTDQDSEQAGNRKEEEQQQREKQRQEQERQAKERQEQERLRQEAERNRQLEIQREKEKHRNDNENKIDSGTREDPTTPQPETTTRRRPIQENKVEPICKLPDEPLIDVDFDAGYRFGTTTNSRIEFTQIPSKIKRSYDISLQFKTNSSDGVLFYAADGRQTDYIALYLQDGKVRLSLTVSQQYDALIV